MTKRCSNNLVHFFAAIALAGCASGYKQFYEPSPNFTKDQIAQMRVTPPTGQPILERSQPGDPATILALYDKRGYVMIGISLFNSGLPEPDSAAIAQGKEVGADLVLVLDPTYTGSTTTIVPVTTPSTSTTRSTGTASIIGRQGVVNVYGSSTSTTYGTTTNLVPITIRRSDFGAIYFVKQKYGLGVHFRDLNADERQRTQTNKGAVAVMVIDDTPAHDADIRLGDTFLYMNGVEIGNSRELSELLAKYRGQKVDIILNRGGSILQKTLRLN